MKPLFTFVFLFFLFIPAKIFGSNFPQSFPWKGVSIDSSAENKYTPQDLAQLIITLPELNFVQLRLKPKKFAIRRECSIDQAMQQTLDWADLMLDECHKLGIIGLLSFEGFPLDLQKKYNHTSEKFWQDKKNLHDVIQTVIILTKRFSKRGNELAGYQFISEPVTHKMWKAVVPDQWPPLLKKIIKTIRKNDPQRWVVVAPGPWGNPSGYRDFKPLGEKIIYGAHMYAPQWFTHQGIRKWKKFFPYPHKNGYKVLNKDTLRTSLQPLRDFQMKHKIPVYIGEFSAIRWAKGGEDYIKDLVSIFNEYNWGWVYFSLNSWHGWNPDYSSKEYMNWRNNWRNQYVGFRATRWDTLRTIFSDSDLP